MNDPARRQGAAGPQQTLFRRLQWFLFIRLVIVLSLLGGTLVFHFTGGEGLLSSTFRFLEYLVILTLAVSLVFLLILRKLPQTRHIPFAYLQVFYDLLFATAIVYITGGSDSIFTLMYYLTIILAGVLMYQRAAYVAASGAALVYGLLLLLEYYQKLPLLFERSVLPTHLSAANVLMRYSLNLVVFYILAYLTSYLAVRLERTERDLASTARALKETERLKENIVYSIDTGIIALNQRGTITLINSAAARFLGDQEYTLVGSEWATACPELVPFMERGSQEWEMVLRRGERAAHLNCRRAGLYNTQGELEGTMLLLRDITELRELEEKMRRQERLAAVGRLAAGIAHEIRNPLASISGSIELLQQDDPSQEHRRLMGIVLRETSRLNGLIGDFLDFARPAPPKRVPFALDQELNEAAGLFRKELLARRGVELHCQIEPGIIVCADPAQLRQVTWNLLKNAAEAIPLQGTIRLTLQREGGQATLVVADDGVGMGEVELSNIFDPFYTTKAGGTGLGLATVYRILEAHGAEISVHSRRGEGTRVRIRMPLSGEGA